jgi:hypothetical protein
MKEENKMKEEGKKEMMENQEKGEVMRFNSYSPFQTTFFDQEGQKWIVQKHRGDRDSDFSVSYYSWHKDHWSLYGLYEAYIVELEGNVLRFQYKQKTEGLYYRMAWKEVILKGDQ